MRYFPAFFDLKERPCLVVGGGDLAARKVRLLRRAGARVTVVARRVNAELAELAADGALDIRLRPFESGDVEGQVLAQSAAGVDQVDRAVSAVGRAAGVPVNVVDRPELSTFIMPAVVERDPLVIGISSGGTAPLLARRVRESIEALLPQGVGRLARFAESFRSAVRGTITDSRARLRLWERVFDGPIADAVLTGDERRAHEKMLALVNAPNASHVPDGTVHIVGAGPGDPELLTLRALRLIQRADVLIYDRLVGPEILDYARRDAERVYVGKAKGHHAKSQEEIHRLMAEHARAGQRVVRLKGGDPLVFGRGGEEMAFLRRHGVRVEIVPGITAATGCAAAAGFSLTHRDLASAVTFVTGHAKSGPPDLDWAALAGSRHTLVIYMGVSTAGLIADRLMAHGMAADTPAAIIENGTLPDERVLRGTLRSLGNLVDAHGVRGPALIVIGEVAADVNVDGLPALAHAV